MRTLTIAVLLLTLTLTAVASEPTYDCLPSRVTPPSAAAVIVLADIRECRLIVTLRSTGTRFWRLEGTHDFILIPLDDGCLWWQAHGRTGIYTVQKQAKMVKRACSFRVHPVLTQRFERWRIRIVEVEGIQ